MSDGIEFGLIQIRNRPEIHKLVVVVTDGAPDWGHDAVVRYQTLVSGPEQKTGVVLAGIGEGATYVKSFPKHVWTASFEEFPAALMKYLREMFQGLEQAR